MIAPSLQTQLRKVDLIHSDVLEPVGPTVFLVEEFFAVGEEAGFAAFAFGRVGAVEVGDMLIAYVAEPAWRLV